MTWLRQKLSPENTAFLKDAAACDGFLLAFHRLALLILGIGSMGYPIVFGKTDFFPPPWQFSILILIIASCHRKLHQGISRWMIPILIYGAIQLSQTSGARATAWSYSLGLIFLAFLLSSRDSKSFRIIYWIMATSIIICFTKVYIKEFITHGGRSSSGENVNVFGINCALFFATMLTATLDIRIGLIERLLVSLGMIAANACVIMSGSRAALLAIISIQLTVLLLSLIGRIKGTLIAGANLTLSCLGWGIAFGSQRHADIAADLNAVLASNSSTSLNARVEFWKTACKLILKNPLTGYGENAWRPTVEALQSKGEFPSTIQVLGHAHNEILNTGFCYGAPFAYAYILFIFHYSHNTLRRLLDGFDAASMAALLTMIAITTFGMFESVFWHPECVRLNFTLGIIPLVVLSASCRNYINTTKAYN